MPINPEDLAAIPPSSPKWDARFMQMAQLVASWSRDPSTKVGCVIADDDHRIISVGFNGFAKGIKDDERLQDRDLKYKLIIHAEENALLHAQKDLKGATLYCYPFLPCASCASKIIQSGIKKVVATDHMPERWKESFELSKKVFEEAGVSVSKIIYEDPIFGIEGFMCLTDWDHELGYASGGNRIYPSEEDIKKYSKCVGECGIAKVRTTFVEVAMEPTDDFDID